MLRLLLAALLLANLLFFGWAKAWFAPALPAPGAGDREPARLAAQVAPERVTVLSPAAASAALVAADKPAQCPPGDSASGPQSAASATSVAWAALPALSSASQAGAGVNPCEPRP